MEDTNFEFIVGCGNHQIFHNAQAKLYEVRGLRVEGYTLFWDFNDAFRFMQALNHAD